MDKYRHGYSPHTGVGGSDGYSEGNPHLDASNVNSREDMSSNPLHQPHRIEKLLENPAEIGILTKLKDNEEARSHAVKKVYDETKVSLGVICPKNLPNDLSEREEKINVFKTEVNKERDTIKEKEEKVQKDLKELIQKYNSIEQKALNEANSDLLILQKESKQILKKIRDLKIDKERVQGSNYRNELSQQTQDLSTSANESCSELQAKIKDMESSLTKFLKENQSKFNQEVQPLLDQAPQEISDMPKPISSVDTPQFAEFNPELKENFNKLLDDVDFPEEKKEFKPIDDLKKPEDFPIELEKNPEYKEEILSENEKSKEDDILSHSPLCSISDEEHKYEVSSLSKTPESSQRGRDSNLNSSSKRRNSVSSQTKDSLQPERRNCRENSVDSSPRKRLDQQKSSKGEYNKSKEEQKEMRVSDQ